jgi:hypothetical protein
MRVERSDRIARDLLQQSLADPVGRLVGRKMADAGEHFEGIGCGDEIFHRAAYAIPQVRAASITALLPNTRTMLSIAASSEDNSLKRRGHKDPKTAFFSSA